MACSLGNLILFLLKAILFFQMANPILRRLRSPRIEAGKAAELLRKHIGDGMNALHCRDAIAAAENMRAPGLAAVAKSIRLLMPGESDLSYITVIINTFEGLPPLNEVKNDKV